MVQLQYASLSQIANELRRRAVRYRNQLLHSDTNFHVGMYYDSNRAARLERMASELGRMNTKGE